MTSGHEYSISRMSNKTARLVANTVRELAKKNGPVRPSDLVDASRPESSPTHHLFEWDDATAGQRYRIEQAAYYIRSVRVLVEEADLAPIVVRPFVSLNDGEGYREIEGVVQNEDESERYLQILVRDLRTLHSKLENYQRLAHDDRFKKLHEQVVNTLEKFPKEQQKQAVKVKNRSVETGAPV